eukprot:scaffold72642_cov17-Tisochrysis_lutea.AAC.5
MGKKYGNPLPALGCNHDLPFKYLGFGSKLKKWSDCSPYLNWCMPAVTGPSHSATHACTNKAWSAAG